MTNKYYDDGDESNAKIDKHNGYANDITDDTDACDAQGDDDGDATSK